MALGEFVLEPKAGHFLVVEDDPVVRKAVGQAAKDVLEPRFAETGQAALQALASPDLPRFVLLDFLLPDLNGLQVLERLRADPRCSSLPVVIFSSLKDERRRQQALQAGANAWVSKPDDPQELRNVVRNLCQTWGKTGR